ncbi:hypothetical protein [Natrinema gelatinilyticum]|uniref:hypothetical protein n=1 Tax=Natrinema gelatinilyticum TaxID=2961571 RepID=UPI0020C2E332|nr:hypothetical protein [Natrinema gelatinilyticum]
MRNNESKGWKRRSLLSTIPETALVGNIESTTVASANEDAPPEDRSFNSAQVQSILSDLDNPIVNEVTSKKEMNGGSILQYTKIKTNLGTVVYAEAENGTNGSHFSFHDVQNTSEIPSKYREIPEGTNPSLIGYESDTVFRRSATDQEINTLKQVTDIRDESDVITGSDINNFLIIEYNNSKIIG